MVDPKRALITGITGQDGTYLTRLLLGKGYQVFGLSQSAEKSRYGAFKQEFTSVELVPGDFGDSKSLLKALETVQPDEIYNFAAISSPVFSFKEPELTAEVTGVAVVRLLEAIRGVLDLSSVRFFQASSCHLFGKPAIVPQTETTPFQPSSPYAAAKAYAHFITVNYRETYGLYASCGILFNHESPLRAHEFVTRKITSSVAKIKLGLQDKIVLGNLDTKRDWGFAGDYVEGMWRMLQQEEAGDFVLATGIEHSIRDWLDTAFAEVGIDDWASYVMQDPQYLRPIDADRLVGDASKAKAKLGWEPKTSFTDLVKMMVQNDLEAEAANPS